MTNEMVAVTPEDREAAADLLEALLDLFGDRDAALVSSVSLRQGAKGRAQFRPIADILSRHRLAERERCAKVAELDNTPGYGPHRADMEALAEIQRTNIAAAIRENAHVE